MQWGKKGGDLLLRRGARGGDGGKGTGGLGPNLKTKLRPCEDLSTCCRCMGLMELVEYDV